MYFIGTNSEESEVDARINALQEQLESRKIESSRLKKMRKKLKLQSLKAKEQYILKQIELYDKKIEESKESLLVDIEKKKYLIKQCSFSRNVTTSNTQIQNIESKKQHTENDHSQIIPEKMSYIDCNVPLDKQLIQQINAELKENFSKLEKPNDCKHENHSVKLSEMNQTSGVVSLPKEANITKNYVLQEEIQTDVDNIVPLNSQPEEVLIHKSNDYGNNFKRITCSNAIKKVLNNCDEQEKSSSTESITTYESMKNTSLSRNSIPQKIHLLDSHKILNDVFDEKNDNVSQLEVSNNETEVRSVDEYSLDFMSDDNSSKSPGFYDLRMTNINIIDVNNSDQSDESSYEEDRSEGDVMFEDKTFIEQYSSGHDPVSKRNLFNIHKIINYLCDSVF